MTPPAHFLAAWLTANCGGSNRRDRAIVTAAGVIPDLDDVTASPNCKLSFSATFTQGFIVEPRQ